MLKVASKIMTIVLLIILLVVLTSTSSMAVDYTCKVALMANKEEVKKGETITILVKVSEIQAGEGIAFFNTLLEYDSNVFDCQVSGDDEGKWQKVSLIEKSLSMNTSDLVAISSDQTIAKIELKAKENAPIGKQTFKLTKMEFSTGQDTFSVSDVSANFTITEESNKDDDNTQNNANKNETTGNNINNSNNGNGGSTSSPSGNNSNGGNASSPSGNNGGATQESPSSSNKSGTNVKNVSTIADSSSSNKSIPKTGIKHILIIGVIIAIIATVIFYIKYKRAY